jgi:hypothetical protein
MARFKILIFLLSMTLLAAVLGGTWWFYTRVFNRDQIVDREIKQMSGNKQSPPDPGLRRFDKAVESIQSGNLEEGRDLLYEMLRHFPDSRRAPEAKRILGEMNLDYLFSVNQNKSRKDHIVQPGESLGLIARKNGTNVETLMRANGMMSTSLQPSDHMFVFPIDFQIVINATRKTVTLLRNGSFFKEYVAVDVRLPPGMKPLPANSKPGDQPGVVMEINDRAAYYHGRRVQPTDVNFMSADKWLLTAKAGFSIRALPKAKAESDGTIIVEPKGSKSSSSKTSPKGKTSSQTKSSGSRPQQRGALPAGATEEEDAADAAMAVPETGVFLAREDTEELFTIIRTKTPVSVVR